MAEEIKFNPTRQPPSCRGCGYLLQGLTEPRCPECGKAFDPADVSTYSVVADVPHWNLLQHCLGWGFALGCGLAVVVFLGLPPRFRSLTRDPIEYVIAILLALSVACVIRVGFTCRLGRTVLGSGIAFLIIGIGFMMAKGPTLLRDLLALAAGWAILTSLVGGMLTLGHVFRRWGLNWLRSKPGAEGPSDQRFSKGHSNVG